MKNRLVPIIASCFVLASIAVAAHAATTDLSDMPLVTSSSSDVHSNLMFVLDDSGSMAWNYLPDWADNFGSEAYLMRNSAWNGLAYNPALRYSPPTYFNADGTPNTTTYPSMNGSSATTGADNTSKPNWKSVKRDGYGVQSTSNDNLTGNAYFYTISPGEYCDSPSLRNCTSASGPTGSYIYPASLRWCTGTSLATCKATNQSDYNTPRYQTPFRATITLEHTGSSSSSTSISGITVGGVQILASATIGDNDRSTVADRIRDQINACATGLSGSCGVAGYTATSSGRVVTIYGISATTATPDVTIATTTDPMTATVTAFARQPVPNTSVTLTNGANLRTVIHSGNDSYPYPGTSSKASARTDCTGSTCTYNEEMTNYANWYAYYQTRMQMMKTATSIAFAPFGEVYDASATPALVTKKPLRVGFYTICASGTNATGTNFLNANEFGFPHKATFYNKLFAGNPVCWTPLRGALSKAGQYYANKLSGQVDPVQYSCQRNVVMLSTDGYWNTNAESSSYGPYQLNNSTLVGNQDGLESRPYNDGASTTVTSSTPTTTVVQSQTVKTETTTTVDRRYDYALSAKGDLGCSSNKRKLLSQEQRRIRVQGVTTTLVDNVTTISTRVVITVNGTTTSDTTSSTSSTANVSTVAVTNSDTISGWVTHGSPLQGSCSNSPSVPNPDPSNPTNVSNDTVETVTPVVTVLSTTGPTVGTTTTTSSGASGGNSNSLADVAEYYYTTDLRTAALGNCTGALGTGVDVCTNNLNTVRTDAASWQHLTTYTLGLGVNGLMQYLPGYQSATTGDYWALGTSTREASIANAANSVCPWMSNGSSCTWPTPAAESQTAVDDLWHAAVNGRGLYFSASDAGTLAISMGDSLAAIDDDTGSSSAATTSNPNVTSGDNFVFESTFTEGSWDGELIRRKLNLYTGAILPTIDWSARSQLDNLSLAARKIYTFDDSVTTTKRRDFAWGQLTTAEKSYFELARLTATGGLTQFCASGSLCLSVADQNLAAGEKVVDFLRGDRTNEGVLTDTTKYFRQRDHLLGDIVNAEAVYVKGPLFNYSDPGYSEFKADPAILTRTPVVYVAANDGMLHAFSASTGVELWAYIPSFEIPSLYQLADKTYKNQHKFFLDGTPVVGEICTSNCTDADNAVWKTILVGGQNKGGRGYYALDITDPADPKVLWEFTNDNLGYTYGNPVISKLKSTSSAPGPWVVMFTSGYNNVTPGDGVGRLFVLNAQAGTLVSGAGGTISTGVGTTADPSGLAKISAWADVPLVNNTARWVYGGDLKGNLWRFDINGDTGASGYDAKLLATFKDASSVEQPISAVPQLGDVDGKVGVFVGTGKYLGLSDATSTTQSFYGVKDDILATSGVGTPRTNANFVVQTMTETTCPADNSFCENGQIIRTGTSTLVDWSTNDGWYFDLPKTNERAYTDPQLVQGTLLFTSNTPEISVCTSGGTSFLNAVNYKTGGAVEGSGGVVSVSLGNSLATRPVAAQLPNGKIVILTRMSGGATKTNTVPVGALPGATRRVSWRELRVDQ